MASVVKPTHTIIKERTKDGEITINLVLTIKLEGSNLVASVETPASKKEVPTFDIEKVDFEIPDFTDDNDIIKFGKNVE